ncbi:PhzA/PhzB family protein, partial [Pseudomonas aeruginosa]
STVPERSGVALSFCRRHPIQKLRALGIAVPQIKRDGIPT